MGMNGGSSVAALAGDYLDAVTRGDGAAAAERYFHPDIVYIVNGPLAPVPAVDLPALSSELHSALPWLGMYRGLDEVRAFLSHMHSNLDVTGFGPREIIGNGQRAAVFGWFGLRSRPAGQEVRIAFSLLVEERDGKIARYQFLENTFDVSLAFRSGGSWAFRTDRNTITVPSEGRSPMTTGTYAPPRVAVERFSAGEPGAWSNSYLISNSGEALLYDVFQLRSDARRLAETVEASGKRLGKVWISHAHPDHFLQLDLIVDRFPDAVVLTTPNVIEDLKADGPWMFELLKGKLGPEAAERLIEPTAIDASSLPLGESTLGVVEFGAGEAKHHACLHLPDRQAFVTSDLIYNGAHLYLQEHNLEGWLKRLEELERFTARHGVHTLYPGHGPAGGLSLIHGTREYLQAFATAVQLGNADSAREAITARFPDYRVEQFLTVFSLPAYFPPAGGK